MTQHPELRHSARAVRIWLATVIAMVFTMVVVGGITRLTGDLSLTSRHRLPTRFRRLL